jgi:hypothetical protein
MDSEGPPGEAQLPVALVASPESQDPHRGEVVEERPAPPHQLLEALLIAYIS